MKIGGVNTLSLSDYPGKVAAVVFTHGCNFKCPFCHNGSLIPDHVSRDLLIDEEYLFEFLRYRSNQLEGVVVSGGEPTIHRELPGFLRKIKEAGFAVKLDTNGSRPEMIKMILAGKLVDYIAMDIKAPLDKYKQLVGYPFVPNGTESIEESIALIAQSGIDHAFRTTVVEALLSPEDMRKIRVLVPAGSNYTLQKFCPENAFDPKLRKRSNLYLGSPQL
ncbi:MAG: anaerobic ribonucleoside-triphosphate reductase activating protein [Planctomycetota bacterium]|nr:MAG: anaerobic ribonucleoside-triphosphate reductase activating protein [Planctomycetota bacterium]